MTDRTQALYDRIDELDDANPWIKTAEVGAVLVGQVKYIDCRTTEFDAECPFIGVKDDNGTLHEVAGFGTVLRSKIIDEKPQPGEYVIVRRGEDKISKKNGKTYKVFKFVVDREAPKKFNWNRLDPGSGEAPAEEDRPLTHEQVTRMLTEEDRKRGPRPVEEKKQEPPAGKIADEDWKAPWDADDA